MRIAEMRYRRERGRDVRMSSRLISKAASPLTMLAGSRLLRRFTFGLRLMPDKGAADAFLLFT